MFLFLRSTLFLFYLSIAAFCTFPARSANPITILAFGDSLIAGYGLPEAEGFVAQLQSALRARNHSAIVIDGGVSGDTSAAGLERIDWALTPPPDIAILELGANDMLRGIDPASTRDNLEKIILKAKASGAIIILAGMKATENFGADYKAAFDSLYPELAKRYDLPLIPFFLEGVAADPQLNQGDGLHPNAEGEKLVVANVLPFALEALKKIEAN